MGAAIVQAELCALVVVARPWSARRSTLPQRLCNRSCARARRRAAPWQRRRPRPQAMRRPQKPARRSHQPQRPQAAPHRRHHRPRKQALCMVGGDEPRGLRQAALLRAHGQMQKCLGNEDDAGAAAAHPKIIVIMQAAPRRRLLQPKALADAVPVASRGAELATAAAPHVLMGRWSMPTRPYARKTCS